ncbi:MAG: electron transfer flavoprotein subunit alpha/FixB family protein, partial [Acidimicrobiales bacterium]
MIVGLVEDEGGVISDLSLQMLTLGRRLAERLGAPLAALVVGPEAGRAVDDRLDEYAPGAWAACIVDLTGRERPGAVLAPGSDRGNEVMA